MSLPNIWPADKPDLKFDPQGWLAKRTRQGIDIAMHMVSERGDITILELGSWKGKSSRHMLDCLPSARLICVDHWEGDVCTDEKKSAEGLFEQFVANCWDYRDRMTLLRMSTIEGVERVQAEGIEPDMVYIDAGHTHDDVYADANAVLDAFPNAVVVGDDYGKGPPAGVRSAVRQIEKERQKEVVVIGGYGWMFMPESFA